MNMKKSAAVICIAAAVLCFSACQKQLPRLKQAAEPEISTYVGILKEQNENAVIVRAENGEELLFWMTEGITCSVENGKTVKVAYRGDRMIENQVLSVVSVTEI